MAISTSFFLVYSAQKIKTEKLEKKPVSIRAQVRYTRSAMAWSIAKRMGHQVERLQFTIPAKAQPRYWANGKVHHNHVSPCFSTVFSFIIVTSVRFCYQYFNKTDY